MTKLITKESFNQDMTVNGERYNSVNVSLYREDNGNMSILFNPVFKEDKDGMTITTFVMFQNGSQSLKLNRYIGRLTQKQQLMAYDIVSSTELPKIYNDLREGKTFDLANYPHFTRALNQFKAIN